MAAIIELSGVALGFGPDAAEKPVLTDVDLLVEEGSFVAVVGPSGVGKSTLLRVVAGLLPAARGEVRVAAEKRPDRRRIGLVFQDSRLLPWRRIFANVRLGLEGLALSRAQKAERVAEALKLARLEGYDDRWPHELSGGQRQRAGIARALAVAPDVLLMDEPFGALDAITRRGLQDELRRIHAETGKTILFVTHDIDEAARLADRILLLGGAPAARIQHDLANDRDADDGAVRARIVAGLADGYEI